jgi:hypothetical protein
MTEPHKLVPYLKDIASSMLYVDGENLVIRVQEFAKRSGRPILGNGILSVNGTGHINIDGTHRTEHVRDVLIWNSALTSRINNFVRGNFYTASTGASEALTGYRETLKACGVHNPQVLHKQDGKSKGVDIMLTTDMLVSACRRHSEIAVLCTHDADFIPLIDAVKREGVFVVLWFINDPEIKSLPRLKLAVDFAADVTDYFLGTSAT